LGVGDVAGWLCTTKRAVYTMAERGQLPGIVRVGRRMLFDERVLLAWLEEKRGTCPEE